MAYRIRESFAGSAAPLTLTLHIRHLQSGDLKLLEEAEQLFDQLVQRTAAVRFLDSDNHHILLAYDEEAPAGFVTGVEMTHPDKGTEMFLYELGVDEAFRGRGYGTQLVTALADIARQRGCYGMWVLTEEDNAAAMATYRAAGGAQGGVNVLFDWQFDEHDRPYH